MPGKKRLKGAGDKERPPYEPIKDSAERAARYDDRDVDVAARAILKRLKKEHPKKGG